MNNKIIIGTTIGLIAGLVLGIFVGVLFIAPSGILPSKTAIGTNNQVEVSGTVTNVIGNTLYFTNLNGTFETSATNVNGQYSVLLLGGQSYLITTFQNNDNHDSQYSPFYVPLGVTTFTENLVSVS